MDQARAETLRRKIELYRSYLRDGVDAGLAIDYLREIAEAEAELDEINRRGSMHSNSVKSPLNTHVRLIQISAGEAAGHYPAGGTPIEAKRRR